MRTGSDPDLVTQATGSVHCSSHVFDILALWRLGLSARVPECQTIKKVGLDQYGPEHFEV